MNKLRIKYCYSETELNDFISNLIFPEKDTKYMFDDERKKTLESFKGKKVLHNIHYMAASSSTESLTEEVRTFHVDPKIIAIVEYFEY